MKKVYSHPSLPFIQHLKLLLESHGIACALKNEFLQSGAGSIPIQDIWPELWIHQEDLFNDATDLLSKALREDSPPTEKWECDECGEMIESQFTECWQCGSSRN